MVLCPHVFGTACAFYLDDKDTDEGPYELDENYFLARRVRSKRGREAQEKPLSLHS